MIELKDGIRSLVRLDFRGRVHKQFRGTNAKERCENEIKVLETLEERKCPNVPRLLDADLDELTIITTSCGKPVEDTLSRQKALTLFAELEKKYGIRHDDQEPRNVTYDSITGKFCIIDFELAEILPMPDTDAFGEKALRIQWSSASQQGRRHLTNQDNYSNWLLRPSGKSHSSDHGEVILPCEIAHFAVSDGVGGNNGGEFASSLVLSSMKHLLETEYKGKKISEEDYLKLLKTTNGTVNDKAAENPVAPNLSATYVGVIFQEELISWANVGDSRVYQFRDGKLKQLSIDHNFAYRQMLSGAISEIEYRLHPAKNQLYDCMGAGYGSVNPEIGSLEWKPDDIYLICSDGIMDGLSDKKIESLMSVPSCDLSKTRAQSICQELLKQAIINDGSDDTTLIVFEVF